MKRTILMFFLVLVTLGASPVSAVTVFEATLSGAQEVPPNGSVTSGTATLTLNDAQDRLLIDLVLSGLDLDGTQTPGNANDDVFGAHIHLGSAGTNGPVVFGFISPNHDLNGDLVINAALGTIFSAWDEGEGGLTTLSDNLPNLLAGNLYFNIHTAAIPSGEIRGQINRVPEPTTLALMGLGLAGLGYRRKKMKVA